MSIGPGGVSHGADVEALRASARELADRAHEILLVQVRLTARAYDLTWNGPDAARFRAEWEADHSPRISAVCGALNRAAHEIAQQADAQEAASSPEGTVSAAGDDLRTRLRFQADVLAMLPDAAKLGQVLGLSKEAAHNLLRLDEVWSLQELGRSGFAQGAGQVLGGLGVLVNAHGVYEGVQTGDMAQVTQSGVPLGVGGLAAAGLIGSGTAAAITVPFAVGSLVGNEINDAMEGTAYGDRVTANFDAVFDQFGALGMVLTPAVLVQSGLDMIVPTSDDGVIGERGGGR